MLGVELEISQHAAQVARDLMTEAAAVELARHVEGRLHDERPQPDGTEAARRGPRPRAMERHLGVVEETAGQHMTSYLLCCRALCDPLGLDWALDDHTAGAERAGRCCVSGMIRLLLWLPTLEADGRVLGGAFSEPKVSVDTRVRAPVPSPEPDRAPIAEGIKASPSIHALSLIRPVDIAREARFVTALKRSDREKIPLEVIVPLNEAHQGASNSSMALTALRRAIEAGEIEVLGFAVHPVRAWLDPRRDDAITGGSGESGALLTLEVLAICRAGPLTRAFRVLDLPVDFEREDDRSDAGIQLLGLQAAAHAALRRVEGSLPAAPRLALIPATLPLGRPVSSDQRAIAWSWDADESRADAPAAPRALLRAAPRSWAVLARYDADRESGPVPADRHIQSHFLGRVETYFVERGAGCTVEDTDLSGLTRAWAKAGADLTRLGVRAAGHFSAMPGRSDQKYWAELNVRLAYTIAEDLEAIRAGT